MADQPFRMRLTRADLDRAVSNRRPGRYTTDPDEATDDEAPSEREIEIGMLLGQAWTRLVLRQGTDDPIEDDEYRAEVEPLEREDNLIRGLPPWPEDAAEPDEPDQ